MESSLSVQSYMAEMHNDSLYFLEQAELASDVFVQRRFYRAALVYICTSIEAAMSQVVYSRLNAMGDVPQYFIKLKNCLSDPSTEIPENFRSIRNKIKTVERLFKSQFPDTVKEQYLELTELRNKIIHFSVSYQAAVYDNGDVMRMAKVAPQIAGDFLSVLFSLIEWPSGFERNKSSRY